MYAGPHVPLRVFLLPPLRQRVPRKHDSERQTMAKSNFTEVEQPASRDPRLLLIFPSSLCHRLSLPFLFLTVQVVILLDIRFFELFLPRRRVKIFIFSCSWGRVDDWFRVRNWIRSTVLLVSIISKNKFGNGKKGKYYEGLIYQAWKMLWAYRGCMINLMGKLKCAFTVVSPKFTRPVSPNEFYIRSPKWPIRSHRSSRRNDISITVLFVYFIHPRASPLIYI